MYELLSVAPEQPPRVIVQEFPIEGRDIQLLTGGNPETEKAVLQHARQLGKQYLPWEAVRGGLGAEVVGKTVVNGKRIPLTGFEGYFVRPGGISAEEVVRAEAAIGGHFADIAIRMPGGMGILREPERIGLGIVNAEVMRELYREFGTVLARLRGDLITAHKGDMTTFQKITREKVETLPSVKLDLVDGKLVAQHQLPSLPEQDVYDKTGLVLSSREEKGLLLLAEIGRFGHPIARSCWDYRSQQTYG